MSQVLTSIGVEFYISTSSTYGNVATGGYVKIPHVIEMSNIDAEPEELVTTNYGDLSGGSSIVDDFGESGVQHLLVNATVGNDAETIWDSMANSFENGEQVWLCISIPRKTDATYIPICPMKTRVNNIPFNDRITTKLYYTITGDIVLGENPRKYWTNETWFPINMFNENKEMTENESISLSDVNMLFNNIFYLKGN